METWPSRSVLETITDIRDHLQKEFSLMTNILIDTTGRELMAKIAVVEA
jgi:hypothetical protein